jgi:hypothetical protein
MSSSTPDLAQNETCSTAGGAGPRGPGRDDPAGHVHHHGQHPEELAACRLHQGEWVQTVRSSDKSTF